MESGSSSSPFRSSLIQFALAGGRAEEREREKKLGISFQFDADSLLESIFSRNGAFSSFSLHFTLPGEGAKRVSTHVLDRERGGAVLEKWVLPR